MSIEELNVLLKELSGDNITTERQLEIFSEIRNDKEKSLTDMKTLTDNTAKLQEDYDKLKKKTVDDFFNYGVPGNGEEKDPSNPNEQAEPEKEVTIDDLVMTDDEMAKFA